MYILVNYIKKREGSLVTETRNNKANTNRNRKKLYGHFKRQTSKISYDKSWTWLRMRNLTRETESLPIAAQKKHHQD